MNTYTRRQPQIHSNKSNIVESLTLQTSYNPGHNILRHFDVQQNFRVITSQTNRDY